MESSKEVWKPIKEYEGLYEVSSWGRVRSLPRTRPYKDTERLVKGVVLAGDLAGDRVKYRRVQLSKNGTKTRKKVHHLVLEAFVGERPDKAVGRHLDDNPLNNYPDNLCWGTVSENTKDKFSNGYLNARRRFKKYEVLSILDDSRSSNDVAESFGVAKSTIERIRSGKTYKEIFKEYNA